MEDNYNIWGLEQSTEDATARYGSAEYRLEDLLEQEKRLLDTLSTEEDTSERLDLERRLSEVQALISELRSFQLSVDDSVIYSAVLVSLFEVIFPEDDEEPLTFNERLSISISDSIDGFFAFCQGALLVLITISPGVLVLLIVCVIAYPIIRAVKKHRKK